MSKVYIVNKGCHDFTPAKKYGSLVYMSDGTVNRYNTSKMYRLFQAFIDESDKDDYILLTGMTIMNVVVASMFAAKHSRINLLIFKEQKGGESVYLERSLVYN